MAKILVVDDAVGIRELLSEILTDEGHDVQLAENAAAARRAREAGRPDLVLLDIWMPDTDGVSLLKEWAAGGQLTMPVLMMSGHATIDTAVEATRIGALDFLEKPIGMQKLLAAVKHGLEQGRRPVAEISLAALPRSAPCKDLKKRLEQVAAGSPAILLRSAPGGIVELAGHLLLQLVEAEAVPPRRFASAALNALRQHGWPGGYAELKAAVKSLALSALGEEIEAEDVFRLVVPAGGGQGIPGSLSAKMLELPLREAREMFERMYFEHHLALDGGNMTRLAEKTGLERTHLYRKLKDLGLR